MAVPEGACRLQGLELREPAQGRRTLPFQHRLQSASRVPDLGNGGPDNGGSDH